MANEYLKLTDVNINVVKAQNLLAVIEAKRKDPNTVKDSQSESAIFEDLFKAFKDFFSNLGKPSIKKRVQKVGSPALSEDYNSTMQEIYDDINLAYREEDSLASIMVKDFNYNEAARQMLRNKVKRLSSDSLDYSLFSTGLKDQSLFGSDTFSDMAKLDMSRISAGSTAAEVSLDQGVVTLKRTGNTDRGPLVTKVTGVKEGLVNWDPNTSSGGYEGLFWGLKGEVRPEGGGWNLMFSSDGRSLFELGAIEDKLMPIRMKMFDDNPDTFWEVEYVTTPVTGYQNKYSGLQISVDEFNKLFNNEVNSPNVDISGDTVVTDKYGSLIENYIPVTAGGRFQYLTVNFTVNLSRPEILNWISLNPNNFGQEMYMQVLSIQTSEDGSNFVDLEGFDDHSYDITLTGKANEELPEDIVQSTLSPDKFKFAGQGIWIFAPRKVAAIRFTIRQTRSYLKSYDVLMVETTQNVTTTTTKEPSSLSKIFGGKSSTSTTTKTVKNQVEIPYLVGQVTGFDVMDLEPGGTSASTSSENKLIGVSSIAGAAVGASVGAAGAATTAAMLAAGILTGGIGLLVGAAFGAIFGGLFSSKTTTSTTAGPQTISRQWTVTKNDKARFVIGIRDIDIFSYIFSERSEIVSKPYVIPKPISKISLTVDEQIPKIFYSGSHSGTENDWIKYYVSVDDGVSWTRISPMQHRYTVAEDGLNFVPQIINVNSGITSEDRDNPLAYIDTSAPVYAVRFRAVLSRPVDITDAESYTPVLSSYSLQVYPLGGL